MFFHQCCAARLTLFYILPGHGCTISCTLLIDVLWIPCTPFAWHKSLTILRRGLGSSSSSSSKMPLGAVVAAILLPP
jgi:hypothetical protein